jgi:hypothetical protein
MKKMSTLMLTLAAVVALVFVLQLGAVSAGEFKYVGDKKCKGCHRSQYKSWQGDYHAKALDSLKPGLKAEAKTKAKLDSKKDYTADAGCLSCHSTGHSKPAAEGAILDNVQCESCHGPGSEYKSPKIMSKNKYKENQEAQHKAALEAGLVEPDEKLCVGCHNEKSPTFKGFNYKEMIDEVRHKE